MQQQNPGCLLGGLLLLAFVGFAGWRIGGHLSSDAMGMAVGMLLVSLPAWPRWAAARAAG